MGEEQIAEMRKELLVTDTNINPEQALDALKALANTDLINLETGITAQINTQQRSKIISNAALTKSIHNGFTAGQHNAVATKIDTVFKYAVLAKTTQDKNVDVNIASIKRFASPIFFGTETAIAYLTVKESTEHGHRIYSLELLEIKKTSPKGNTLKERTTGEAINKITQLLRNANTLFSPYDTPNTRQTHEKI